jgi:branched-chain amino acid transport system substrate-binding protein
MAKEQGKITLATGPATTRLTNEDCSPTGFHWVFDTYSQAVGTARALVAEGGKSWFLLVADYAFGTQMANDLTNIVKASGGSILGEVKHPLGSADFSSFLLQAQASKAQIIGLANAGADTINTIKQAAEFGIARGGQKLAGLVVVISDVHALGLPAANGLVFTTAFYWDLDDKTRAFAKRFSAKHGGKAPTSIQAGFYSAALAYLNAVKAAGTDDSDKVMATLKATKWDDPVFGPSYIRPDGRKMHTMYLFEVKKPSESKGPWDYYKLVSTIPGEEAFRPMDQGECPLVTKKNN